MNDKNFINDQDIFNDLLNKEFIIKDQKSSENDLEPLNYIDDLKKLKIIKDNLYSKMKELDFYDLDNWSEHTKSTDYTAALPWYCRVKFGAEVCTRAWLKFYEILSKYKSNIFPNNTKYNFLTFNTAHLCEAPGGFISALNHWINSNFPDSKIKWIWKASSLNPYYEGNTLNSMIPDSTLINNHFKNWLFGDDFSGDILSNNNYISLIRHFSNDSLRLVSADGGIDCSQDPSAQESLTFDLIKNELFIGLSILQEGGSLICKIFTNFEPHTLKLLIFVISFFKKVILFKPCCSGKGNSEKYLICFDCQQTCAERMDAIQIYSETRFPNNFEIFNNLNINDLKILHVLIKSTEYFSMLQINSISSNINLFGKINSKIKKQIIEKRNQFNKFFVLRTNIKPLCENVRMLKQTLKKIDLNDFNHKNSSILVLSKIEFKTFLILGSPVLCKIFPSINYSMLVSLKIQKSERSLLTTIYKFNVFFHRDLCSCKICNSIQNELSTSFIEATILKIALDEILHQISHFLIIKTHNFSFIRSRLSEYEASIIAHKFFDLLSISNKDTKFSSFDDNKVDFYILLNLTFNSGFISTQEDRNDVLYTFLQSLQRIKPGGYLYLTVDNLITFFNLDIIFCLTLTFQNVFLYRPVCGILVGTTFILAKGFLNFPNDIPLIYTLSPLPDFVIHHFCDIFSIEYQTLSSLITDLNTDFYQEYLKFLKKRYLNF